MINDPSILVPNIVYIAYSMVKMTLPIVPSGILLGTYCNVKNDKTVNSFPDTAAPVCIGKSNWFDSLCFYLQNSFTFMQQFSGCCFSFVLFILTVLLLGSLSVSLASFLTTLTCSALPAILILFACSYDWLVLRQLKHSFSQSVWEGRTALFQ